jgi:hypothetical protein
MILQAASKGRPGSRAAARQARAGSGLVVGLVTTLLVASPGPLAQEEAGTEEGRQVHRLTLGADAWVAQPAGLAYVPARELVDFNSFSSIDTPFGTETAGRYFAAFRLPEEAGAIVGDYFHHSTDTEMSEVDHGNFVFGEALVFPAFAGVGDDGLADSFVSTTSTSLYDWKLAYSRTAFRSGRALGEWSLGWRRVKHRRQQAATYFAALPPLPVLPEGASGLEPLPDRGEMSSHFESRGLNGGLDLAFNLWRDRVIFETAFSVAVMRGDGEARSSSTSHFYICDPQQQLIDPTPATAGDSAPFPCQEDEVLADPDQLALLGQVVDTDLEASANFVPVANSVEQFAFPLSVATNGQVTTFVADVTAALRWRALDWLDARVGFRQSRYTDVGLDVRPTEAVAQEWDEVARDATYEGFFFGVAFHLY